MYGKILVPLDGSALAETVLPEVIELATRSGAELVLLRVALAHALPGADQTEAQVRAVEEAGAYLATVEARVAGRRIIVQSAVRYGRAAKEILDHAKTGGADLIAMATHGRTGVRRWVLGSVAETVLRAAPVPVLLVRARIPAASGEESLRPAA
jgi:nucleotide-binding universal stress UspA family protein